MTVHPAKRYGARSRGFTLIELMIAMLLGLVVIGSVIGVMLANKRSNSTNEGLIQVQESARTAYELLAHDIRQADGSGCGATTPSVNVLTTGTLWWQNWFGMRAFDSTQADDAVAIGTAVGARVAGTDSIRVESMDASGLSITSHVPATQTFSITAATTDLVAGDIVLACDSDHTAMFQASAVSSAAGTVTVRHQTGIGTPGNAVTNLNVPCPSSGTCLFRQNALIGRLVAVDWYVGNNAEGGRSLYRQRLGAGGVVVREEVVAGVVDMQIQLRANGDNNIIADPSLVTNWAAISSVLIQITAQSSDVRVSTSNSTNSGRLQRTFNYIISLRNRLP